MDWIDGLGFTGTMVIVEGPGGLTPGAPGDGFMLIEDADVLDGMRILRTAPLATTEVAGAVANNAIFDVIVKGAPGAWGLFVVSLDTAGGTLPDLGDIGVGFTEAHMIWPLRPLGPTGELAVPVTFHGLDALVGERLAIQGFTVESGEIGIGNGLQFVVGSECGAGR